MYVLFNFVRVGILNIYYSICRYECSHYKNKVNLLTVEVFIVKSDYDYGRTSRISDGSRVGYLHASATSACQVPYPLNGPHLAAAHGVIARIW